MWTAAFLLHCGRQERGHKALRDAERANPELKAGIDVVLADDMAVDLATSGFTWLEDRYVTNQDVARVGAQTLIDRAVGGLTAADPLERANAYQTLEGLGPRAASAYHRGLVAAQRDLLKQMQGMGGYAKLAELDAAKRELHAMRENALSLIFDEYEYPYPHNTPDQEARHSAANQEIDRRVLPLRKLWDAGTTAKISADLRTAVRRMGEYAHRLTVIGIGQGEEIPAFLLHLPEANEVTVRTLAWTEEERERIDTSYAWMQENAKRESIAKPMERRQVEVTNEYRLMMGRHAVKMNDLLVECARMHSEDMSRLGFFAHENPFEPLKRTPGDRLKWVGFYGSGASENIAATGGDPVSPHRAWLHSSGHHRNILGASWRLLGSGNSGRNWTQNFSIRQMTEEDRERSGLPKGGIRTLHEDQKG
ncbi:MAG: hypothetical protein R3F20_19930 [Planctomycetota bacterium]